MVSSNIARRSFSQPIVNVHLRFLFITELLSKCVQFISHNFELSGSIDRNFTDVVSTLAKLKESLAAMQKVSQATIPDFVFNKNLDLETLLSTEMEQMDRTIHEATLKIEQMIAAAASRQDSGVKLEVNGKILEACTSLMQAIKQLIQDSKQLQLEIASKERVIAVCWFHWSLITNWLSLTGILIDERILPTKHSMDGRSHFGR